MTYEPSQDAIERALNAELDHLSKHREDWCGSMRAAIIAAHEDEQKTPREVTENDVAILISVLGLMLDDNRYTKPCVKAALEAVEAHRAKKG